MNILYTEKHAFSLPKMTLKDTSSQPQPCADLVEAVGLTQHYNVKDAEYSRGVQVIFQEYDLGLLCKRPFTPPPPPLLLNKAMIT